MREAPYLLKVHSARLILDQLAHMVDKIIVPRVFLVKFLLKCN